MNIKLEKQVANILLERGVKVQIKAPLFLRWLGREKITYLVKAPTVRTLVRIADVSLDIDVELEKEINIQQATKVVQLYGKKMSKIAALAILNSPTKNYRLGLLTKYLYKYMPATELYYIYQMLLMYGGYEDFINTIRFTQATRITKPMNLSQNEKRS